MIFNLLIVYSLLSYLNPLNWGKDISNWGKHISNGIQNSFKKEFEDAMFYFFSLILKELLAFFSSLFALFDYALEGIISSLVYSVSLLGPASFPIFIVILFAIGAGLILLIGLAKDVPVVEAFV